MGPDAAAMASKFSFYSAVLAASVLAPGLCLVTTGVIALLQLRHPDQMWAFVVAQTRDLSTPLAIVVGLNFLSLSFIVGYLFRELSFWLVGLLERIPRFAALDAPELLGRLEAICGRQALDDCLRAHPLLAYYLSSPAPARHGTGRVHGGGHRENRGLLAFEYCKRRLRLESPALAVDNTEAEVNILASCLFPVLFVTAEVIWIGELPVTVDILAAVGSVGAWLGILMSLHRLRRTERIAAVTNLVYSKTVLPPLSPGPAPS
ncbi:hypothetical protein ACIBAG_17705 [Streptomyces sp. NPDC051243]|uniref:hypothetical protein n=1 Tax=Streptomyces sp. NPDC051243 TaxID=3365646 RepID=UPI00378AE7D4